MPPDLTWLVRHAQSTSNVGLPATGHGEVQLTAIGHQQSRELAKLVQHQPDLLVVSPFLRAWDTAAPMLARWPLTCRETWPIQELTYLSPTKCAGTTVETRRPMIEAYWCRCDPDYRDGPDAESFRSFVVRLVDFRRRLLACVGDFVVVVGHGQFFRAFQFGQREGFDVSADWMKRYRAEETAQPMANCEIVELTGGAVSGNQT